MKTYQITASELIELSYQLSAASYKTIDQFLFKRFGMDYYKLSFYDEVKSGLESMMVRTEVKYDGYVSYEWVDRY